MERWERVGGGAPSERQGDGGCDKGFLKGRPGKRKTFEMYIKKISPTSSKKKDF